MIDHLNKQPIAMFRVEGDADKRLLLLMGDLNIRLIGLLDWSWTPVSAVSILQRFLRKLEVLTSF